MTSPGYEIGRDDTGLTRRERQVLAGIAVGSTLATIAGDLGIKKQRAHQIKRALLEKGVIRQDGEALVVVTRTNS